MAAICRTDAQNAADYGDAPRVSENTKNNSLFFVDKNELLFTQIGELQESLRSPPGGGHLAAPSAPSGAHRRRRASGGAALDGARETKGSL
jgi:hypothetical protein